MAFEIYKRTRATSEDESVSITPTGNIVFSPVITEQHLKNITHVEIYFDSETKRIGVKPTKQKTPYSYTLVKPQHSRRASISGSGFLGYHKLFQKGKRFEAREFPAKFERDMIVFS